uniref:Uncharacterized protein n=1 Tax=Ditylum brightwellii TaxID=49249 RepID=A0A7S4VEY4_9STRA
MPALKRYIKNEYKNWTNQANTHKQQQHHQQQDDANDSYKIMTAPKKYTIINGATKINPAYNKGTNQSTMPQQRQQQENTEENIKIMTIPRKNIIINGVTKKNPAYKEWPNQTANTPQQQQHQEKHIASKAEAVGLIHSNEKDKQKIETPEDNLTLPDSEKHRTLIMEKKMRLKQNRKVWIAAGATGGAIVGGIVTFPFAPIGVALGGEWLASRCIANTLYPYFSFNSHVTKSIPHVCFVLSLSFRILEHN